MRLPRFLTGIPLWTRIAGAVGVALLLGFLVPKFPGALRGQVGMGPCTPTITYYPALAGALTIGPDGNVWFGAGTYIGSINSAGVVTEHPVPGMQASVDGIAKGSDGTIWFTDQVNNAIGRMKPDGSVTAFPIPTPGAVPRYITAGPDNALWFVESGKDKVGRISLNGDIQEFPISYNGNPERLVVAPDGKIWFTYNRDGVISVFTMSPSGVVAEIGGYSGPAGYGLSDLAVDSGGDIWVVIGGGASRITNNPASSSFNVSNLQLNNLKRALFVDSSGTVLVASDKGILFFPVNGPEFFIGLPDSGSGYGSRVVDGVHDFVEAPDGTIWFSHSLERLGKITPCGGAISAGPPADTVWGYCCVNQDVSSCDDYTTRDECRTDKGRFVEGPENDIDAISSCALVCGGALACAVSSSAHAAAGPPVCGNGNRETGEQCDDGNKTGGDGCSGACITEAGWRCVMPDGGSSSAISSVNGSAGGFQACATGTCTRELKNGNLCTGVADICFGSPDKPVSQVVGTCGNAQCAGQCVVCVAAASSAGATSSVTISSVVSSSLSSSGKSSSAASVTPVTNSLATSGNCTCAPLGYNCQISLMNVGARTDVKEVTASIPVNSTISGNHMMPLRGNYNYTTGGLPTGSNPQGVAAWAQTYLGPSEGQTATTSFFLQPANLPVGESIVVTTTYAQPVTATAYPMITLIELPACPATLSPSGSGNGSEGSCTDTDWNDLSRKGLAYGTNPDYCLDSSTVVELSCQSSGMLINNFLCPAGTQCSDGACVAGGPALTSAEAKCHDSDNGFVTTVAGIAYKEDSFGYEHDECVDISGAVANKIYLNEVYCKKGGGYGHQLVRCSGICKNGACQ